MNKNTLTPKLRINIQTLHLMRSGSTSEIFQVSKGTMWKTTVTEHQSSLTSAEGSFGLR
jgi:hypothetical protein